MAPYVHYCWTGHSFRSWPSVCWHSLWLSGFAHQLMWKGRGKSGGVKYSARLFKSPREINIRVSISLWMLLFIYFFAAMCGNRIFRVSIYLWMLLFIFFFFAAMWGLRVSQSVLFYFALLSGAICVLSFLFWKTFIMARKRYLTEEEYTRMINALLRVLKYTILSLHFKLYFPFM